MLKKFLILKLVKKYRPSLVVVFGGYGREETRVAIDTVLSRHRKTFSSSASDSFDNLYKEIGGFFSAVRAVISRKEFPNIFIIDALPHEAEYQLLRGILGVDFAAVIPVTESEYEDTDEGLAPILKELERAKFAFLNYDDESVRSLGDSLVVPKSFYGFEKKSDLHITSVNEWLYAQKDIGGGSKVEITYDEKELVLSLPNLFGKRHIFAAACALGVSKYYDIDLQAAIKDLKSYEAPEGSLHLQEGIKGTALFVYTQDVTPASARETIQMLGAMRKSGKLRRVSIILGDIIWRRQDQFEGLHETLGELAAYNANMLFLAGERVIFAERGAKTHGMLEDNIYRFDTVGEASRKAQEKIDKHDGVLIMGCLEMHMEQAVDELRNIEKYEE